MHNQKFVNRETELAFYDQLVNRKIEDRILLIKAKTGMGKTLLLSEFEKRCPKDVRFVPIDFKGGGISLAEVFFRVRDWLGRDKFTKFSEIVKHYLDKSLVTISDNNLFGRNSIDIALSGSDQDSLEERRVNLTDAFMADLDGFGKTLFVFDTFNSCQEAIVTWIINGFLPRLRLNSNLMVIIAGQTVPEPTLEWMNICHEISLEGVSENHWLDFANIIGSTAHVDAIKDVCIFNNGNPLQMVTFISTFVKKAEIK